MFNKFKKTYNSNNSIEYLIVGLGNPGMQYEKTRHNVGFMAVDYLCSKYNFKIDRLKFKGLYGECVISEKRCLCIKPQTFMNNSGECVSQFANFYKIPPENIIVIFDDISLDVGKVRIRRKGSHGGHNGVKDICFTINSDNFPRVKIGIGAKPHPDYDLADWVLGKFPGNDLKEIDKILESCPDIIEEIISGNIDSAMNRFSK